MACWIDTVLETMGSNMTARSQPTPFLYVSLGRGSTQNDGLWKRSPHIRGVIRFNFAAPSGRRLGSRALGLGLDSAIVALKVLLSGQRGPYLAANPWVGVALKVIGKRRVSVTGVYARSGSRSFDVLRKILASSPVVTTVALEAEAWNVAGGNSKAVLYGNTYGYPRFEANTVQRLRVFVGGSSDRDTVAVDALEAEIHSSNTPISLTIVSDETPMKWKNNQSTIERTGRLSADQFGALVAQSDVVFLPLLNSGRAAGHMVTVGALESGVAVLATSSDGMNGYIDGVFVSATSEDESLITQLARAAEITHTRTSEIREFWKVRFSLPAYIDRVGSALEELHSNS